MSSSLQECPRCLSETRLRVRTFSDQAIAALVVWEEITKSQVGDAICDECYEELRDVLIERAAELESGQLIPPAQRKPTAPVARPAAAPVVAKAPAPAAKTTAAASTKSATSAAKPAPAKTVAAKAAKPADKKTAAKKATDTAKKKTVKRAG